MSFLRLQRHTIFYASFPIFDISIHLYVYFTYSLKHMFFSACSLPFFAVKRKLYVCLMRYRE